VSAGSFWVGVGVGDDLRVRAVCVVCVQMSGERLYRSTGQTLLKIATEEGPLRLWKVGHSPTPSLTY
jgi:hypothetical protein